MSIATSGRKSSERNRHKALLVLLALDESILVAVSVLQQQGETMTFVDWFKLIGYTLGRTLYLGLGCYGFYVLLSTWWKAQ